MSLIAGNLAVIQRLLDESNLAWAVCAGAASHLYGERRPINDIDILVEFSTLSAVVKLLQQAQKAVQFDGQRILWRGIRIIDDLTVRKEGRVYAFQLDLAMRSRFRRMPLLGARVAVMAPEDVVLHKLLLARGAEQGKHDLSDVVSIIRRQELDRAYIAERLTLMNARALLGDRLADLGVALDA